ncbi:sensor domain-containing diguanylate cyclase [Halopseudomonas sp.]|uniref:sensor domain-containing diguanylate cyclase n=1 Tax=Halopseudomonas sp. TaxID=2901191 RepID=UPI0030015260
MPARLASRNPKQTFALIALLFALLLAAIFYLWQALLAAEQTQAQARLQLEANSLAAQIEGRFQQQTGTLIRFAERWDFQNQRPHLWQADAERLLRDFKNFQAIEWLDSSYRMRWIQPLAGNEAAINLVYHPDHPNYPVLVKAQNTGKPHLSSPFKLVQGGQGLAYYVPLYREADDGSRTFDGFLLGIFRVEVLLADLLRDLQANRLSVSLEEHGETLMNRPTSDQLANSWRVTSPVVLGENHNFVLVVHPTQHLLDTATTRLPLMIMISGSLAALLLCYSLWLAIIGARRNDILKTTNRQLQAEVVRRQSTEESLKNNQARLKLIIDMTDHSHDALFIIGLDPQELVYLNRTCWQSLGYSEAQLRQLASIAPKDIMPDVRQWLQAVKNLIHNQGDAIFQQHVVRADGKVTPLEISVRHLRRLGRDYLICVGRNNSEQLEIAERLQRLSNQDGLTGLYNRRYFDKTLLSEWRRLRRENTPLGLLMLDVDYFKRFNDQLGHQAGDDALQRLANAMNGCLLREGDCVCRYGGEEFAIILPGADLAQCMQVARRIHEAVQLMALPHPNTSIASGLLSVSIGAASLQPMPEWSPHDLIKQADAALYRAKAEGRNRTCDAQTSADATD